MSTQSIENSLIDLVAPQAAIAVVFACAHAAAQQDPTPLSRKMVPTGSLAGGVLKIENLIGTRIREELKRLGLPPQSKLDTTSETVLPEKLPGCRKR